MPRMGNTMAAQSQIWKDSQAPGGDNPYKSGLSVHLPGMSPGLSGRDHEGSCGCSSISVYQLTGSDKGQHTVENGNDSADALALYLILPAHRKPREAFDAFFLLQGFQPLFSFSVSATITDPDAPTTPEHQG